MRALVLWADDRSSNLGVRALAAGTAALVRRAHPGATVEHVHYGSRTAPSPVGDWRPLVRARLDPRVPLRDWLASFDLAVDTRAGDSFADIYGLRRLTTQSMLARLAHGVGTPVVLGPQTVGPFGSRRGRALARLSLRDARAVMVRDSVSEEAARSLGRPADVRSTDVVFALPRPQVERTRDVVLNVSGLLWAPNPHVDHEAYRATVLSLTRELLRAGRRVSLLAHVLDSPVADNDVPAVHEVAARVDDGGVDVVVPTDLEDVRRVTASAHLVLGSRMHACLNALSTGTPAIPLAYSRKFGPLLGDLGWHRAVDLRTDADPVRSVLAHADADLADDVTTLLERAETLLAPAADVLHGLP